MVEFPLGAQKYKAFREAILKQPDACSPHAVTALVREPDRSLENGSAAISDEMELQSMWFGGEFGRVFQGTGGESIEIVQFGHWNKGAGPDFSEVAVKIDGKLLRGSLEIDLDAMNWEHHGHGNNPAFDDVVLHVFLSQPKQHFHTRNSLHRAVTQLKLDTELLREAKARDLPEAFPGRCVAPLREMDERARQELLESAAQYRIQRKLERLSAMAAATNGSQALFQAICEALGFRHNKTAMAVLAQRNQFKDLIARRSLEREARLFGSAGFMEVEGFDPSLNPAAREYLKNLWSEWWKFRPEAEPDDECRKIHWKVAGCRPMNHPQRRLGAVAVMLEKWRALSAVWERPDADLITRWTLRCEELSHFYWNHHYTLTSRTAPSPMKLVGKDRQHDILGNVIFPWVLRKHPGLWEIFTSLRGTDSNEPLRRARLRLFGDEAATGPKRANNLYYQQQALLQIYQDFCLEDFSDCKNCPFPEQLKQW